MVNIYKICNVQEKIIIPLGYINASNEEEALETASIIYPLTVNLTVKEVGREEIEKEIDSLQQEINQLRILL